ncbi:hypothetical protein [Agromyces sp. ZXT2-3]|uniref:hypothetical protein n=1 Tax=Agromyces sp. ZXT2-3 TaxID=3461152 RepID=UPI004054FCEC
MEYSIGSGSGAINIDKSVTSGRDQGQSTLRSPSTFATYIQWLYNHALAYKDTHPGTTYSANDLVLQYLRQPTYAGVNWENAAGPILTFWVEYIDQQPTQRIFGFVSPRTGRYIHVSHFAAALHGMIHQNGWPADEGTVGIGDMTGWAGDLVQSFGDWIVAKRADPSLSDSYAFGRTWIARKGGHSDHDFDEDVDAAIIAAASLANPSAPVSDVINASYAQPDDYGAWYTRFLQTRFGGSTTTAYDAALDTFDSLDPGVVAYREGVLGSYLGVQPRPWEFTPADLANLAQAWTDILSAKIAGTE